MLPLCTEEMICHVIYKLVLRAENEQAKMSCGNLQLCTSLNTNTEDPEHTIGQRRREIEKKGLLIGYGEEGSADQEGTGGDRQTMEAGSIYDMEKERTETKEGPGVEGGRYMDLEMLGIKEEGEGGGGGGIGTGIYRAPHTGGRYGI